MDDALLTTIARSTQWALQKLAAGDAFSLAGYSEDPHRERRAFVLNSEDADQMRDQVKALLDKNKAIRFALIGEKTINPANPTSVLLLYVQGPAMQTALRFVMPYVRAADGVEAGETWYFQSDLGESWLPAASLLKISSTMVPDKIKVGADVYKRLSGR